MQVAADDRLTAAFSFRYLVVLTLLGVLTVGGFLISRGVIEHEDGSAALLNLSGRQRMLSQRIVLLLQEMGAARSAEQRESLRGRLLWNIDTMARTHRELVGRDSPNSTAAGLSPAMSALYFGPTGFVDRDVSAFIGAARKLADVSRSGSLARRPELHWIKTEGRKQVLRGLDAVVGEFQRESEQRVERLQAVLDIGLSLMLAALAGAALFIFRPMVRRLNLTLAERQHAVDELQDHVERFRNLIELSPDAVFVHRDQVILYANAAAVRLARVASDDAIVGRLLSDFLLVGEGERDGARQKETGPGEDLPMAELKFRCADGNSIDIESVTGMTSFDGAPACQTIVRDVTDRKQAEVALRDKSALVQMLHGMTSAFNDALTGFEAIRVCLAKMCEYTGWPVGHAFVRSRSNPEALVSTGIWRIVEDGRFDAFRSATEAKGFAIGDGLPGRVLANRRPEWPAGPYAGTACSRGAIIREVGLRSGFALPVLAEGEVVAVLEFYTDETVQPDEALLQIMTDIGMQLGVVVERKRTEEVMRRSLVDQQIIASIMQCSLLNISLDEMLNRTMDMVLSGHGLGLETKGSIFLVDAQRCELVLKAQKGLAEPLLTECARLPFGKCLCGSAAESGEVVFTNGLDHRHEISFDGMRPHGHYCIPIKSNGNVLGVLNLYVPEGHQRTEVEDRFVTTVANTLAGIIQRKLDEDRLRYLSQAVEQSPASVMITDTDARIQYVNPKFVEVTGYEPHEVVGENPRILNSGNVPEARYRELWQTLEKGGEWRGEFHNRKKDGELFWERVSISPIKGADGKATHYLAVKEDITLRKEYEEKLLQQATIDSLTGLPNRFLALDRLSQALFHARRTGALVALMFIDLDHFKKVNDTLGHLAGDALLAQAAERLSASVRESDTVARMGGDEFMVILTELDEAMDAERVAYAIIESYAAPFMVEQHEVVVTPSIGITLAPNDGEDAGTLLRNADAAMYRAKSKGRATFLFFTREMNEKALAYMRIENELRHARARDELSLSVQPLISNESGEVVGGEVLMRWNSGELGFVSPADFIPVAEETGLIVPFGEWVLQTACLHAAQWQAASDKPVYVAVNISSRQFKKVGLVAAVRRALEESGLPPQLLELEITEGILLDNSQEVREVIDELSAIGVRFSIDDFGTGYSSLSYLRRIPFHTLKIDRSFVDGVTDNQQAAELVRSIIAMAGNMHLTVIAEGVESEEQWNFLCHEGCAISQGWYFSKAMPIEQFGEFLAGWEHRLRLPVRVSR